MPKPRLADALAALSLVGDLGEGHALEHTLRATYLACRIAAHARLDDAARRDVLYTGLLRLIGCVGNAHDVSQLLATDEIAFNKAASHAHLQRSQREEIGVILSHAAAGRGVATRASVVVRALSAQDAPVEFSVQFCEVAALVGRRAGLGHGVAEALRAIQERWDGRGRPNALRGDAIPLAARVVYLGAAVDLLRAVDGDDRAVAQVREGRGVQFDPALADTFLQLVDDHVLAQVDAPTLWEDVLGFEPAAPVPLTEDGLDDVAFAFADAVDLKSRYFVSHSRRVAAIAEGTARALHLSEPECVAIRRAALLHDIGRASVPNVILDKPGALTPGERERVRLHAYYTGRILAASPLLSAIAPLAAAHHERLDGSGYPRGVSANALPVGARILAVADVCAALGEARAYRAALDPVAATRVLEDEVKAARLDGEVARAVLSVAFGARPPRPRAASGLSERELEVLRLVAEGQSNKEIARHLVISENTARHHLESVYAKLEVRSRAGAIMRALERGLL